MFYKYLQGDFGYCFRVLCSNVNVFFIGLLDRFGEEIVKIYCLQCCEVYFLRFFKYSYIDGSVFGRSFFYMFFMVFFEYRFGKSIEKYILRLYGFKIYLFVCILLL